MRLGNLTANFMNAPNRLAAIILFISALGISGCASLQNQAIEFAQNSLDHDRYQSALRHLHRAEHYGKFSPDAQAEIIFLRGQAYEGLGRLSEAITSYKYVIAKFPDTQFAYQAKERLSELRAATLH